MSASVAKVPNIDVPASIAAIYPHEPRTLHVAVGQIEERVKLVKTWGIHQGEKILEIGCGQGDCTVTLATAVGDSGFVTAIDPASLDYGSPFTLGQAQAHLRASPVGNRINFVQADPLVFLQKTKERYTTAVLAHCIWYFSSPDTLAAILTTLARRVERICIAEYALNATDPRANPHVLAALTEAALECHKPVSISNIRTVLSPAAIKAAAAAAGLRLENEERFIPPEGMMDGQWEVGTVLSNGFRAEISGLLRDERERSVVVAMRHAVREAVKALQNKGEKVHTMDIWAATFGTKVL